MHIKGPQVSTPAASAARSQLQTFLAENTAPLLGTIRSYVQRMGLASREAVPGVASEVLQEVVVEALDHVDRFDPARQPMAWLLGIAMNVIKRKRTALANPSQRELTFGRLSILRAEETGDENTLLDQILPFTLAGPEQDVESDEQARLILSLVSVEDQHILRLAILYGFEGNALAQELGITHVAARVRLHRALSRLRSAWNDLHVKQQEMEKTAVLRGKDYE